jgi:serine/threonine protein kinase
MQSIRPLSVDFLMLKKRISEGMNSSGKSVIVDALFTGANTREQINVKAKIIDRKHLARAQHEYEIMNVLQKFDSSKFVRPYALLDGSMGQIGSEHAEDDAHIASSICIVMEFGVVDMLQYFSEGKRKDMPQSEKLGIVQQLLGIVAAARKCGVVLLDFKLANIVRVSDNQYDFGLKAIDFENSRMEGEEVPAETTAAYSSPEVAEMMLARGRGEQRSVVASHKMDIMALGFVVFEMANNMTSFWKSQGKPTMSDTAILVALASLQDEEVGRIVENTFRGDQFSPLRRWLKHALSVHQISRASCDELLHAHSLFGSKDRTLDQNSLINQIGNRVDRGIDKVIINADTNANTIKGLLAAMRLKMDAIHTAQVDVSFVMRQAALDSAANHLELKASLSSLGSGLTKEFAGLERMKESNVSVEDMNGMIQSAVQAAMIQVNAAGLDASIKEVISSTPTLFPLYMMLLHPYIVLS